MPSLKRCRSAPRERGNLYLCSMNPAKRITVKALVLIIIVFSIRCSPQKLPEPQILPASQYSLSQQQNGISLAIDPFFEKKRVKKYFKANLLHDRILPIFVVVENQSDNLILIHPNDLISAFRGRDLSAAEGGIVNPESAINNQKKGQRKNAEKQMDALFAAGGFAGLLVSSTAFFPTKDYEAIKYNIFKKMLLDKTLAKNEVTSGFIFLKFADKSGLSKIQYLQARVKNLKSGESEVFVYPLKSKGKR